VSFASTDGKAGARMTGTKGYIARFQLVFITVRRMARAITKLLNGYIETN